MYLPDGANDSRSHLPEAFWENHAMGRKLGLRYDAQKGPRTVVVGCCDSRDSRDFATRKGRNRPTGRGSRNG